MVGLGPSAASATAPMPAASQDFTGLWACTFPASAARPASARIRTARGTRPGEAKLLFMSFLLETAPDSGPDRSSRLVVARPEIGLFSRAPPPCPPYHSGMARGSTGRRIPTYFLYGEAPRPVAGLLLHVETIEARSS